MLKRKSDLKIKLLQIRDDQLVRSEELSSFARFSGLKESQIIIHNVFDHPSFGKEILAGVDAIFIGGASEASVLEPKKYPFIQSAIDLINECIKADVPVFASCFGFQLAVLALGGKVHRKLENFEMGTLPIKVSKEASTDPIFAGISDKFSAVSVHQESAFELPESCTLLAYTDYCIHSFRVEGKPFWAFQFHPELDRATLTDRLRVFQEKYTDDPSHYNAVIEGLVETPISNSLLLKFVNFLTEN